MDGESTSGSNRRYPKRKKDPGKKPYGKKRFEEGTSGQTLKVINLSNIPLTNTKTEILSLGLTFSPASTFDCFTAVKDLDLFARKFVLKKIFYNRGTDLALSTREDRIAVETLTNRQLKIKVNYRSRLFYPPPNFPLYLYIQILSYSQKWYRVKND